MKNLVISLEDALDRRQHIKVQFEKNKVAYEFFDAVNASQIKEVAHKLGISIHHTKLGDNEIACFLSHASIWQWMVDNNYPHVCIFEDDIYLGVDSNFYLNNILQWKPTDADILKFEVYNKKIKVEVNFKKLPIGGRKLAKLVAKHTGCAGYMVTLKTASILLDIVRNTQELIPVDHIVFGDFLYNYQANIYQIMPAICIQSQHYVKDKPLESYLEPERKYRQQNTSDIDVKPRNKITREFKRLVKQSNVMIEKSKLRFNGIKEVNLTYK